jgi:signal transduction histidine kinase
MTWRPLTFRARLTLRWTIAFGLLLAVAELAIYGGMRRYVDREVERAVRTLAATEAASATDGPVGIHLHERYEAPTVPGTLPQKLVQVFDESGRLILQSRVLGDAAPLAPPDAIRSVRTGGDWFARVTADGRPARVVLRRVTRDSVPYVLLVGLFVDGIEAGLTRLAWLLVLVWSLALAGTSAVGFALASSALTRVEGISRRAAAIARGDLDGQLDPPVVDDELGRMTQSLNELLARLHTALQSSRRFAADASHELRGPITAMAGEIDVTLKQPRSAGEYRDTLIVVRAGLDTLTALTEDLMLLVRAQESRRDLMVRELALARLLRESVDRLQFMAASREVTVSLEVPESLVVFGESRLLSRAIDNVLANAIRYNRRGGTVVLRASFADGPANTWTPGRVTLQVIDTGVGIPEGERERVFERFHRLDHSRARHTGGAGLGLAISREVLDLLGGSVRVAASSPQGTTIEIDVPGLQTSADAQGPTGAELNPFPTGTPLS